MDETAAKNHKTRVNQSFAGGIENADVIFLCQAALACRTWRTSVSVHSTVDPEEVLSTHHDVDLCFFFFFFLWHVSPGVDLLV